LSLRSRLFHHDSWNIFFLINCQLILNLQRLHFENRLQHIIDKNAPFWINRRQSIWKLTDGPWLYRFQLFTKMMACNRIDIVYGRHWQKRMPIFINFWSFKILIMVCLNPKILRRVYLNLLNLGLLRLFGFLNREGAEGVWILLKLSLCGCFSLQVEFTLC
jgi:hypothetical protein